MRRAGMLLGVLCLWVALLPSAAAEQRVVNVYNWTDYIDPAAIEWFQRVTGIRVRYDVYDSLETLEGKLLAGRSGYDVVVPSAEPTLSRLVRAGALLPLDRARLPHLSGLDAALMQQVATADPGNRFGAIYLWGTTGLGADLGKVQALAPDAPTDSWALLFRPENAKRLAACGITLLDSAIDVVPSVLKYLGRSPDSTDPADLAAVERTLLAIRPYVRAFVGAGAVEQLASGEVCLALDYSGDVIQAAARAREAGRREVVSYIAPKEGAELAFDVLAIPKDAPHPQEALEFIDFVLRPEVIAVITNKVRYANAVPASLPQILPAIADDPGIYPPAAARAGFFLVGPVPPEATRARSRMWARVKAGG